MCPLRPAQGVRNDGISGRLAAVRRSRRSRPRVQIHATLHPAHAGGGTLVCRPALNTGRLQGALGPPVNPTIRTLGAMDGPQRSPQCPVPVLAQADRARKGGCRWRADRAVRPTSNVSLGPGAPSAGHRRRCGRTALLAKARRTLATAESVAPSDPDSAFVLAHDAARYAATALLAHQGLRPHHGRRPRRGGSGYPRTSDVVQGLRMRQWLRPSCLVRATIMLCPREDLNLHAL